MDPHPDTTHHQRAKALFLDALDRPEGERDAFLAAGSVGDDALATEVRALLAAHDAAEATGHLDRPLLDRDGGAFGDPAVGRAVGPWRLTARLGEGGMGAVYRAERADGAYERAVAVKLIRPGPDLGAAPPLGRRLAAERRILARLEHPHVARLYDGGVTAEGAPYLVMELVDGTPVTAYAEARGLDVEARLRLFLQVCDAVAYAHRHLVVHRDLKPSNVLVTEDHAGAPQVKLLDFGIATLLAEGDDGAARTRTVGAMTPAYAAPEQVRGEAVTTATDVYALGVLLYELLAGRRPYELARRTAAEVERLVCEAAPPRPSQAAPDPALARRLRGDLDTVVAKAMAKEPERRYASAEALAEDLRRHLAGLPVAARPASAGYRLRKFAARHRAGVAAAAAVAVALVGGLGAALWQAHAAQVERQKAERVSAFLQETLASADPYEGRRSVTVEEVLDEAAARAGAELAGQPEIEAAVRHTLGTTYHSLGRPAAAARELERALALRRRLHGDAHPETAATLDALGTLALDRADYPAADTLLARALAVRRRHPGPGAADLAATLLHIGALHQAQSRPDEAEARYREALALARRAGGGPSAALAHLGTLLYEQGAYVEADTLLAEAEAALRRRRSAEEQARSPRLAAVLNARAWVHYYLGAYDRVQPLLDEALAIRRRAFGPGHPEVGLALNELGWFHQDRGRYALADSLLREALATYRAAYGDRHEDVPAVLVNLAAGQRALGHLDAAAAYLEEALRIRRALSGDDHPDLAYVYNNLARVERERGRLAEAERLFREGLALRRRHLPAGHAEIATSLASLGQVVQERGRLAEAEELLREAVAVSRAAVGPDHLDTIWHEVGLSACLTARGTPGALAEAERLLTRALPRYEATYGSASPWTQRVLRELAALYDARGDRANADRYRARLTGT